MGRSTIFAFHGAECTNIMTIDDVKKCATFQEYAPIIRPIILQRIESTLNAHRDIFADCGSLSYDVLERISIFARRGKILRALLAHLSYIGYGGADDSVVDLATAMELMQSFLLIHDDIMDKSDLRRDHPSMHTQYSQMVATDGAKQPRHIGNSLAICAGDICFALSSLSMESALRGAHALSSRERSNIRALFYHEITRVGIAQMDDIKFSDCATEPSSSQILELYHNKTGYYSIALPLKMGAMLARSSHELESITEIGRMAGAVFQMRDDCIDLMASKESGKSSANDFQNRRRTYIRQLFLEQASPQYIKQLHALECQPTDNQRAIQEFTALLTQSGVLDEAQATIHRMRDAGLQAVETLRRISPSARTLLADFMRYCATRQM